MLMNWLEPTIEKRIMEVTVLCEEENKPLHDRFLYIINELKNKVPEKDVNNFFVLENLFVEKMFIIETAYREGLKDGLKLRASIEEKLKAVSE